MTRQFNQTFHCPNCKTWNTAETMFGRWIRQNKLLDGGEQRRQFQIVADSVISARTVRPGGGRRKQSQQQPAPDYQAPTCFDNEIGF
jgi:hypothetical protein